MAFEIELISIGGRDERRRRRDEMGDRRRWAEMSGEGGEIWSEKCSV